MGHDPQRFYTLWTLKESLVKAVGIGLNTEVPLIPSLPFLQGQAVRWQGRLWYGQSQALEDGRYILSWVSETPLQPRVFCYPCIEPPKGP